MEAKLNKSSHDKNVAIILGFYEGQQFIEEQLLSIFNQTHKNLKIYLTDDCSRNKFVKENFKFSYEQIAKMSVHRRRQNEGFANNFLHSLDLVKGRFDFVSFCDQDDIWYEDKLERALDALSKVSQDKPALYCARTEFTDAGCRQTLGYSTQFKKPPSFANSLIQNIGGGNTMVLNKAAFKLIKLASKNTTVVSHDWWCYQMVTGSGGVAIYDSKPCLKYRQHGKNLVGENRSLAESLERVKKLFGGRLGVWSSINISALEKNKHLLTQKNLITLNYFAKARRSSLLKRLYNFKRSGVHRQTILENIGLTLALFLNKL